MQAVAFVGALAFGRIAGRYGAQRTVLGGLVLWIVVVLSAFAVPRGAFSTWLALAVLIGLVLGGTQALSRSLFSRLVPQGAEAEYFSLYQAGERGTSWLGTLVFGLVAQLTGSYRPALVALLAFFVVGRAAHPGGRRRRSSAGTERYRSSTLSDALPRDTAPARTRPPHSGRGGRGNSRGGHRVQPTSLLHALGSPGSPCGGDGGEVT